MSQLDQVFAPTLGIAPENLRELLDKLPVAAYTCSPDGLITYYNESAVDLWGRQPELNSSDDRFCGSWRLFSTDGAPISHDACWMALALREGAGFNAREIRIERPDNSFRTALAHANPLFGQDMNLAGAVNVLVDITARKDDEARLRDEARNKDEFLSMLAHELRNPLAPIRSGLELISARAEYSSDLVSAMRTQVDHLVHLVDDLLDASRVSRGAIAFKFASVDLHQVIENAVAAARPLIDEAGHRFKVTTESQPVRVQADEVRLCQAITNLLSNACRYTPAGGQIELECRLDDGQASVEVRDNGQGIDRELLPHIFEPFRQGEQSLARATGGLGIGLTLVRSIIEAHGGQVIAESEGDGRGSAFRLEMDSSAATEIAGRPPMALDERVAALKVLIVDDNRLAAQLMSALLRVLKIEAVGVAYSGAQALEMIRAERPDAVFLDIGMLGMDGFETATAIRAEASNGPVFIVGLSGYGEAEIQQRAKDCGFDEYLVKPARLDDIASMLVRTLNRMDVRRHMH